jgi:ABC-type multidrug transport system fused ATPase/permease subunit
MRDSHLYFLDEPFAELDEVTAKLVLRGIESVTKGKTLVVISHLPWGMENFDEIIVLEAGRITQRGKHQDLIQQEGYYSRLYQVNRN